MNPPDSDSSARVTRPRPQDVSFDLGRALSSVVSLRAVIPEDGLTAAGLGTQREGNGVVIGEDGLILTIGYLITEAEQVWLIDDAGRPTAAYVVGYDQESGFGLVRAVEPLSLPAMRLGSAAQLRVPDPVIVAGHGGLDDAINARVVARREFAGYWEYLLDDAIFTAPAHPNWGDTALIGADGELCGIGSLLVQQSSELGDHADNGNMFVPIDLLHPILGDLLAYGRRSAPPRPWLGCFVYEVQGHLVVAGVYDDCPADKADVRVGDIVLSVAGQEVTELADMLRRVWSLGAAGVSVPLTLAREGRQLEVAVASTDRNACLKSATVH